MNSRWDLAVYDQANRLMLAVEVKSLLNSEADWAIRFRRNIAAHGLLSDVPFFLFAFPDRFYLWKNNTDSPDLLPPSYTIDPQLILQPYLSRSGVKADQLSSQNLELILSSWLTQVLYSPPESSENLPPWVLQSGMYEAIAGGHLEQEIFA